MTGATSAAALPASWTPADRGVLGLLLFLATEAMFFAGLVSTLLILRGGTPAWPPPGQPRLPVGITAVNTLVLLASAVTMRRALTAVRAGRRRALTRWLAATAGLGTLFLAVQGSEWIRLLHHGLSATAGPYGATFFTLIGAHGVHVAGALVVLALVLARARAGRYAAHRHGGVELCWLYWCFVVSVWPVLWVLVYIV